MATKIAPLKILYESIIGSSVLADNVFEILSI